MIVVLLAWVVLSIVLGLVIGAAIHRADRMAERTGRPTRSEDGVTGPHPAPVAVPSATDGGFRIAA